MSAAEIAAMMEHAHEAAEARPRARAADPISDEVGSQAFVSNHHFEGLRLTFGGSGATTGRLTVSRFYFGISPPVVVDIVSDPDKRAAEIEFKRGYFAALRVRYVLIADAWDVDAVVAQLTPAPAKPKPASTPAKPRRTAGSTPRRGAVQRPRKR